MALLFKLESAEEAADRSALGPGLDRPTEQNLGASTEIHRNPGPGPLESAYQECLCYKHRHRGGHLKVRLPLWHQGIRLDGGYQADLVVEDSVVVDLKTVDQPCPVDSAERPTDRRLRGKPAGVRIKFNLPILRKALKRRVNHDRAVAGLGPSRGSRGPARDEGNARDSSDALKLGVRAPRR
ncbi:MAG: GxxExxY protein [Acidobacteriota bacterium]|nr:GxxExxY protein [Acidobacteriota bacterium]